MSQGTLYIVSAPSGAGKTSLVNALCEQRDSVKLSVSHTTRAKREGEEHGKDYYFVQEDAFLSLVKQGDFLEHAQVFDNYYGTSQSAILEQLGTGMDVILEIDWQGAQQVRELVPDACSIFILPPSSEELERRLQSRGQDDAEIIARRMQDAQKEMSHYFEYDFMIINDDFKQALGDLESIFRANRLDQGLQASLNRALLKELLVDS